MIIPANFLLSFEKVENGALQWKTEYHMCTKYPARKDTFSLLLLSQMQSCKIHCMQTPRIILLKAQNIECQNEALSSNETIAIENFMKRSLSILC